MMKIGTGLAIFTVVCLMGIVVEVEGGITSVGFLENYPVARVKRSCGGGNGCGDGCGCQPPPVNIQVCPPKPCCCQQQSQSCCCCQPKCCCCPPPSPCCPPPPPVIKIQTCCPQPSPPSPCCCSNGGGGCGNGGCGSGGCGAMKSRAKARGLGLRPQGAIGPVRQANPTLSSLFLAQQPPPMMPLKAKAMAPKQKGYGAMPAHKLWAFDHKSKNSGAA